MGKSFLVHAALVMFVATSGAAAQTDPVNSSFSLPGADFTFPMPAGYCVPAGAYETNAKMTAAADTMNLTDLAFYSCAEMAANAQPSTWGMVKTPLASVNVSDNKRQDLIDYFKGQINPDDLKKMFDEGTKKGNEGIQNVFGAGNSVGLDMKPLDSDANAVYFGGTLKLNTANGNQAVFSGSFSVTAVKGRLFFLYLYGPYHDVRDITTLLDAVKAATAAFVNANGG